MRRVALLLTLALLLTGLNLVPVLAADPAPAKTSAIAPGFDAEAFRKNFVAGLGDRPNFPALTPDSVQVDEAVKAATFDGVDIYAVKGRLAPAEGQAQPFLLFISADGKYHVSDIISLSEGKSILKDARDKMRAEDLKGFGQLVLKGPAGKPVVVFVSDPFCPYCREAYAHLMGKKGSFSEFRLAHFPLPSHPGADIASALMAWAGDKAPKKAPEFVRFAYTELAVPKLQDNGPESLKKAWSQVAAAFLARFPELKSLGKDGAAIVTTLADSPYVGQVAQDMAKAGSMDITGTPVVFVNGVRVVGFDPERLDELLK